MDDFHKKLGKAIAQARKKAGFTQEALAFECDLHPTYISQMENGLKSPTVRTLNTLSYVLKLKSWELLQRADKS